MSIDRRGIVRGPDHRPVSRVYADDDPSRSPGASLDDIAHQGYSVIDRANQRGYNKERLGTTEPVRERPDVPWDERDFGHIIY